MFKLAYPIDDEVIINGFTARIDMSFDNILRLLDMLSDKQISELTKIDIALEMLLSARFLISYDERYEIYKSIMENFVLPSERKAIKKDDAEEMEPETESYSISEDAEYIYPSFLQDYGIDLFEQQGKLHWLKFRSLLGGLREDTKFKKVVEIRQWKPDKDTSPEQLSQMRELQSVYALEKSQEQIEFESMDILQKREYLEKMQQNNS